MRLALAIVSGLIDVPVRDVAVIGEIGLGGEVRSVTHVRQRVSEARKLGFERCIVPNRNLRDLDDSGRKQAVGVSSVDEAIFVAGCARV